MTERNARNIENVKEIETLNFKFQFNSFIRGVSKYINFLSVFYRFFLNFKLFLNIAHYNIFVRKRDMLFDPECKFSAKDSEN